MSLPPVDETKEPAAISGLPEAPSARPQSNEAPKSPAYRRYLKRQRRRTLFIQLSRLLLLAGLLALWEIAARLRWVDSMLTSKPSQIFSSFRELTVEGDLLKHTWTTGLEMLVGIALSMAAGTLIAILFWWSTYASKILEPYIVVLNALPKVALGPIFYIWLGDRYSIYGMAIAISIIVTIMMIESGFKELAKTKLKLMESFGATRLQMLKMVMLPASVPNFIATLKVNVGLTLVGVIMGEFLSSKAGLGYLIIYGGQVFQMNLVMVSVCMLALMSVVAYGVVNWIGNLLMKKYHYEG
ncbi:ABC transporter permease [Cohnella thailandensis]|uniref:ABC transporter permease n=1 Tax=Cohnella thailandensis TaxID=557557 RepID=A0A841T285_9BACL|nr:ABC transporter permease [Cohnella thailandensis]MBB6635191.1 ABC transporter permease [Cohnella thailandensis]MBP1974343.1 NitT/TauT family transport system permease protein [Cohnella thailandensis]